MTDPALNNRQGLRNLVLFGGVAAVLLVLDRVTKMVATNFQVGQDFSDSFLGLFHFRLLLNTGGAWSIFDDATLGLALFSVVICLGLGVMFAFRWRKASWLETLGFAMVIAGGVGNMIDRFLFGHVVDFICLDFMSFPVFNIADIGVTCGFVLLFLGLLLFDNEEGSASPSDKR